MEMKILLRDLIQTEQRKKNISKFLACLIDVATKEVIRYEMLKDTI